MRPGGGAPDTPAGAVRVVPEQVPGPGGHARGHRPFRRITTAELEDLGDEGLLEVLGVWRRRIACAARRRRGRRHLDRQSRPRRRRLARAPARAAVRHPGGAATAARRAPRIRTLPQPLRRLRALRRDRRRGERLVLAGAVVAWVPAATRFPGELWLPPEVHDPDVRRADLRPWPAPCGAPFSADAATVGAPLNLWIHTAPAEPSRRLPLARGASAATLEHGWAGARHRHRPRVRRPVAAAAAL